MTEDNHTRPVQYVLGVDNEWRRIGLVGLCFLAFLVAVVIMFVFIGLGWLEGELGVGISVGVVFGAPIAVYYLLRRRQRRQVTISLWPDSVVIQRKNGQVTFHKDQIKSYEAFFDENDSYDMEVVIIRPIEGSTFKLYATDESGSLKEMNAFRLDFTRWAQSHQLKRWQPWYRRRWVDDHRGKTKL